MPWKRMELRGKRVFAKCDAAGNPLVEAGKVAIRYSKKGKEYNANRSNLKPDSDELLPDSEFGESAKASVAKKKKSSPTKAVPLPTPGEIVIYTDGAAEPNPGPCGLGVIFFSDDETKELSEYLGEGTNNIAELTAILRALQAVPDPSIKCTICTDSKYSIGVLQMGWKAKANKEIINEAKKLLARFDDCELVYVKAHVGIEHNEKADQLAVAAVKERLPGEWKSLR